MSFQINKNSFGRVIKKPIIRGITTNDIITSNPYLSSNNSILINRENFEPVMPIITSTVTNISGQTIEKSGVLTQEILNKTENVVEGIASSNKVLTLDSNKNVSGIGILKCNSIKVNNVNVVTDIGDPTSIVVANDYFSNNVPGVATDGKCLVSDSNNNVSIKKISGDVGNGISIMNSENKNISLNLSKISNLSSKKWLDVIYSVDLKKFLAYGHEIVATSNSGNEWTEYEKEGILFKKIVWSTPLGKYVGCTGSKVLESSDGVAWTDMMEGSGIVSIAIGKSKIVAINNNTIFSKDFTSQVWVESPMNPTMGVIVWNDICFGSSNLFGDIFVIVGNNNISSCLENTITNGSSWITSSRAGSWNSVSFGNDVFIAVNKSDVISNKITMSSDGVNWFYGGVAFRAIETGMDLVGFNKIKFLEFLNIFIIIPIFSINYILYTKSGDDIYYSKYSSSGLLAGLDYSPLEKKIVGITSSKQLENDIGNIRAMQPMALPLKYMRNSSWDYSAFTATHCFDNSPFPNIIFACNLNGLLYSSNGIDFNKCFILRNGGNGFDQLNIYVRSITYANNINKFVAVCQRSASEGVLNGLTSSDGITWQFIDIGLSTTNYIWIDYSTHTNKIYAMGANSLAVSADGIIWTAQNYTGAFRTSMVGNVVILHGNHSGKFYHILNENLTYTPIDNTVSYLSPFIPFVVNSASTLYSFTGNIVYKSTDGGIVWSIENNLGVGIRNMVLHKEINNLVVYTNDQKIYTMNSLGVWMNNNLINGNGRTLDNICYSDFYKCIYLSQWSPVFSITRTTPIVSECLQTGNVYGDEKIWRTLPNFSTHNRDLDDSIITAMKFNTNLRTLTVRTRNRRNVIYSRNTNKTYIIGEYNNSTSFDGECLMSSDNFLTSASTNRFSSLIDMEFGLSRTTAGSFTNPGIIANASSDIEIYNKISNSSTTMNTGNFITSLQFSESNSQRILKYCKEIRSIYFVAGTSINFYYVSKQSGTTATMSLETFTYSGLNAINGSVCKELNIALCVENLGGNGLVRTLSLTLPRIISNTITLTGKTLLNVEYHYEAKMFIILSTNAIYYSKDGTTVFQTPTVGMSDYIYTWKSMKYIPELNVMGIASTNMFAFTRNGIDWTIIPTTIQRSWISFDYNSSSSNIMMITSLNDVFVSSAVIATVDNVLYSSNSYLSKDKLSVFDINLNYSHLSNDATLNVSDGIVIRSNSRDLYLNNTTANALDIRSSSIININKTNGSSPISDTLKIKGNPFITNNTLLSNIMKLKYRNSDGMNLKLSEKGGSVSLRNVNTGAFTLNNTAISGSSYNDMGLVVADNMRNINIKNVGLNQLNIDNSLLKDSVVSDIHPLSNSANAPPKVAPFLSLDKYMNFKNTNYMNGNTEIIGSAYSPQLNTIVIVAGANSSQVSHYISTSNDKGKSWVNTRIAAGYSITSDSDIHTCKLKWIPSLSVFILAMNNGIMVSKDGYLWLTAAIAFGANPSIIIDTKLNRIAIATTSKIAYPVNSSNLLGEWIIPAANQTVKMFEYFQPLNLYFFRDSANNIIKNTNDIYANSIVSESTSAMPIISDMIVWNNMLYYTAVNNVYRRDFAGTTVGNLVFTTPSINFRRLVSVGTMNILVAFSNRSFAYTTNGTIWSHISYSNLHAPSHGEQAWEGTMNNMFWIEDRLMMLLASNGSLLESRLEESKRSIPVQFLESTINNRLSSDRLLINSKGVDTIIRHSNTPINTYATAYGNQFYVTVGDNISIISKSLKKNQSFVSHVGEWRDVVYHEISNQFIKIGINVISALTITSGNEVWPDSTEMLGNWNTILSAQNKLIIFGQNVCKIATADNLNPLSGSTVWNDITLSPISTWNGIKIIEGNVILTGLNYISFKPLDQLDNNSILWTNKYFDGNWNDVSYGKNIYVFAGDKHIGRSYNLNKFYKINTAKNYHKIIYVRIFGEFFLINKDINNFSNGPIKDQTDSVIRSYDGTNFINSMNSYLHASAVTTARQYRLSNIYYFEEVDQFAFPLNNSSNKYYIFTTPYANKASNYKMAIPETITSDLNGQTVEIARKDITLNAPLTFNVFQDSAAKPGTSTWITTSDERLKEEIVPADLNICFNNVKNLDLKYFKWKDEYIGSNITSDRRKLGWIAQEVEEVIPKSVKKKSMFGIEDCRILDSDQIIANMFGAVKLLIKKIKQRESNALELEE